jgi:predicted RNA methylase
MKRSFDFQGNSVLDLGCGTGRFAEPLAQYFSARIIGIDPSIKMLTTARENISNPIPDDEFKQGLRDFKRYCRENDNGEEVYEEIDLFVFRFG